MSESTQAVKYLIEQRELSMTKNSNARQMLKEKLKTPLAMAQSRMQTIFEFLFVSNAIEFSMLLEFWKRVYPHTSVRGYECIVFLTFRIAASWYNCVQCERK